MNEAIEKLKKIRRQQDELSREYYLWMQQAFADGLSSTKISRELGISETAVRLYRKRKGISGNQA